MRVKTIDSGFVSVTNIPVFDVTEYKEGIALHGIENEKAAVIYLSEEEAVQVVNKIENAIIKLRVKK